MCSVLDSIRPSRPKQICVSTQNTTQIDNWVWAKQSGTTLVLQTAKLHFCLPTVRVFSTRIKQFANETFASDRTPTTVRYRSVCSVCLFVILPFRLGQRFSIDHPLARTRSQYVQTTSHTRSTRVRIKCFSPLFSPAASFTGLDSLEWSSAEKAVLNLVSIQTGGLL